MSRAVADVAALPPPPPMGLRGGATHLAYVGVWESVARMPERLVRRVPGTFGNAWFNRADPQQHARVRSHMARLAPDAGTAELDELTRAAYVSYARYWVDAFRLHRREAGDVAARCLGENLATVDDALSGGEGAILATGHLGSWDIGALWSTHRGWPMTVVAEVVEPRRLFDRFVTLRQGAGLGVIPLVRGGDMLARLTEVVHSGGLATLLADRDLSGTGPVVSFFGEPCRLPAGAAALARRTGRPVAVGAFMTRDDDWHGVIQGPAMDLSTTDVAAGTQQVAWRLEQLIRRFPEQWHVFVRNWLVDREPDHPAVAAWQRDPEGWLDDPTWRAEAAAVDGIR